MHVEITLSELSKVVQRNFAAPRWQPMILLGAPGCGKTSFIVEVVRAMYAAKLGVDPEGIYVLIEKPARRDAAEIAGVALPNKDAAGNFVTKFSRSPILQRIHDLLAEGYKGIILLWDEVAAARDPEQKVVADSFDPREHSIGGEKLPDNVIVLGTGNRAQDKAGSTRLMAHLTNRALVFNIKQDVSGLARWWTEHGHNPVAIECAEAHADDGFFADKVPVEDGPYCTPRSLEEAAHHLDVIMADPDFTGTVSSLDERLLAANVGATAARTLVQWIAQRGQVPNAADILRDPNGAKVPDQTGFQMIAANVAMGAVEDNASATAVMHYILRLRTDLRVPLVAKLLRLSAREGWVITDPAASAFIAKHHELLPLAAA